MSDDELEVEIDDELDPDQSDDKEQDEDSEDPKDDELEASDAEEDGEDGPPEDLKEQLGKRAEKRIRQLVRERNERDDELNQLKTSFKNLATKYKEIQSEMDDSEDAYIKAEEDRLEAEEKQARAMLVKARENDDTEAEADALESLTEVKVERRQLTTIKSAKEKKAAKQKDAAGEDDADTQDPAPQRQPQKQQRNEPDERTQAWAKKNSWFIKPEDVGGPNDNPRNRARTLVAASVHQELINEGFDPSDDDGEYGADAYFKELTARVEEAYPMDKGDNSETPQRKKPGGPGVGRGARTPAKKKVQKVKLSQSELALAEEFQLTPEQYAKEKLKIAEREGA